MKIKVPVPVKMVITPESKEKIVDNFEDSIRMIKLELEQLQFQHKKLLAEAQKKGAEAVRIVQDRIGFEHQKRKEKLDRLILELEQIEKLEYGDELLLQTVESEIDINVGDNWDHVYLQKVIVIKDGIVIEIRSGGSNESE